MAYDTATAYIAIDGAQQQIAAAVQTAIDAAAVNDITQEELDAIIAQGRLSSSEVANSVAAARARLGL